VDMKILCLWLEGGRLLLGEGYTALMVEETAGISLDGI
jgi:hypothetical protein